VFLVIFYEAAVENQRVALRCPRSQPGRVAASSVTLLCVLFVA